MRSHFSRSIHLALSFIVFGSFVCRAETADGELKTTRPEIVIENGPEKPQALRIKTDEGFRDAEVRAVRLKASFPDGNTGENVLLVIREPKSGLVWWENQNLEKRSPGYVADQTPSLLKQFKFFLTDDKLIGLRLLWMDLFVTEGRDRQPNMEKAIQGVLATVKENLHHPYGDPVVGRREIKLSKTLGRGFFYGSKLVANIRPSELADVDHSDSTWKATLIGPDGEHATVVFGDDLQVQSAKHEGKHIWPDDKK